MILAYLLCSQFSEPEDGWFGAIIGLKDRDLIGLEGFFDLLCQVFLDERQCPSCRPLARRNCLRMDMHAVPHPPATGENRATLSPSRST